MGAVSDTTGAGRRAATARVTRLRLSLAQRDALRHMRQAGDSPQLLARSSGVPALSIGHYLSKVPAPRRASLSSPSGIPTDRSGLRPTAERQPVDEKQGARP